MHYIEYNLNLGILLLGTVIELINKLWKYDKHRISTKEMNPLLFIQFYKLFF